MSKCDVFVHLDTPGAAVRPGGRVTGSVEIRSDDGCTIRRLLLTREWRTHGRGSRDTGAKEEHVLAEELAVRPGASEYLPFAIDVPQGPLTYRGHLLNVDWYVRATADLAWRRDPSAELEVIVRGGEEDAAGDVASPTIRATRLAELPPGTLERLQAVAAPVSRAMPVASGGARAVGVVLGGCALLFILPFVFILLTTGASLLRDGGLSAIGGAIMLVFTLLPLIAAVAKVRSLYRARRNTERLGEPALRLPATTVARGGSLDWSLHVTPPGGLDITAVRAQLEIKESAAHGSGTSRRVYSHTVQRFEATHDSGERLAAGDAVLYAGRFPIPADAPVSFIAPDNKVLWSLEVTLTTPGWPDWRMAVPVTVTRAAVPA